MCLCLAVHQGRGEVWVQAEMEGSNPQILLHDGLHQDGGMQEESPRVQVEGLRIQEALNELVY